jgi:hypothetical protein
MPRRWSNVVVVSSRRERAEVSFGYGGLVSVFPANLPFARHGRYGLRFSADDR